VTIRLENGKIFTLIAKDFNAPASRLKNS